MSNYAKIKKSDISNGDGDRVSIFFTGCNIHCKGCFNEELQNPLYGNEFTDSTYNEIKSYMTKFKRGLSILGGEPFSVYNRETVCKLIEKFKEDFPDKTIYIWSGYTLETLKSFNDKYIDKILEIVDILVDGPFIEEKRDLNLSMRGSSNQNIISLK